MIEQEMTIDESENKISNTIEAQADIRLAPSNTVASSIADQLLHGLADLLTRYVLIGTFTYDATTPVIPLVTDSSVERSPVVSFVFPQALFSASQLIRSKLQHFQFFKGDIAISFKSNSTVFQQGSLLSTYVPYMDKVDDTRRNGTAFLASLTSNISEVLTLEDEKPIELHLPYANITDEFDMSESDQQFGLVELWGLTKFRSPLENDRVVFSVFAKFENISYSVAVAGNSLSTAEMRSIAKSLRRADLLALLADLDEEMGSAQGLESEVKGTISNVVEAAGSVAAMASHIPVISQLAKPVKWAVEKVADAAALFGFSKAINDGLVTYVNPIFGRFMENTMGQDNSRMLAMFPDNAINPTSLIPEAADEMSFEYIKQRRAYIDRFTVDDTFTNGSLVYQIDVVPVTSRTHTSAFQYATLMFDYWRGSLEYVLTIVKNKYVTGRLVLVYFPGNSPTVPETIGELTNTNYHVIIDLNPKDGLKVMHVPFKVPYLRSEPWLKNIDGGPRNGRLGLYVLNSFVYPETVTAVTDMLLALSGGDDFRVAVPHMQVTPDTSPRVDTTVTLDLHTTYIEVGYGGDSGDYVIKAVVTIIETGLEVGDWNSDWTMCTGLIEEIPYQIVFHFSAKYNPYVDTFTLTIVEADDNEMGVAQVLESVQLPSRVDFIPSGSSTLQEKMTVGEEFVSFRSLIKRFYPYAAVQGVTQLHPTPFSMHYDNDGKLLRRAYGNATGNQEYSCLPSLLWNISFLYRFWAGSSRYKMIGNKDTVAVSYGIDMRTDVTKAYRDGGYGRCMVREPSGVHLFEQNPVLEFTVPFYSTRQVHVVGPDSVPLNTSFAVGVTTNTYSQKTVVYEAAGDDFTFFFLTGPPVTREFDSVYDTLAADLEQVL